MSKIFEELMERGYIEQITHEEIKDVLDNSHIPFYIGFALFLFVFAGAIGSFLSPHAEKIFGSKKVVYFSMWATFPMMILFSCIYKSYPNLALAVFFVIGFTTMLAQPVTMVWAQRILPEYKSIVG